jgi:hypothetical protein
MLGIDRVGVHDNFFDLGGNSLTGLRITRALKERLGASISDVSLYEAPTVGALTRLIGLDGDGEGAAAGAAGEDGGRRAAAPAAAEVASRSRGARRKERMLRKRDRSPRA